MRPLHTVVGLVVASGCGGAVLPAAPDAAPSSLVGPLPEAAVEAGCSCTYSRADGVVVASGEVTGDALRLHLGGAVVRLAASGPRATNAAGLPTRAYAAGDWRVVLDTTKETPCAPGDLECEGAITEQALTVTRGGATEALGVVGGCGC